jgi:hypothetical protein
MADDTTVERLHRALMETEGDPKRLSDERLTEIGVTRTQAREYAAILGGMVEALGNPLANDEALGDFVAHVLGLRARNDAGEDGSAGETGD